MNNNIRVGDYVARYDAPGRHGRVLRVEADMYVVAWGAGEWGAYYADELVRVAPF